MDYITIMTRRSPLDDSLNFAFILVVILVGTFLLFSAVRMGRRTKVAVGVIAAVAVIAAVMSYQHCNASGNEVIRSNEAEIERAYGLSAEDMKKRMHPDDGYYSVSTIMKFPRGGMGHYMFDTGSGLQRVIINAAPAEDPKGALHVTMYDGDGSIIRPAPPGERARTVGNGHIVSWSSSPKPDGDHGDDGAVQGSDWDDDGVTAST